MQRTAAAWAGSRLTFLTAFTRWRHVQMHDAVDIVNAKPPITTVGLSLFVAICCEIFASRCFPYFPTIRINIESVGLYTFYLKQTAWL